MSKLQGLIPAAGMGTRARPYTHATHKAMLDINGKPNLQRLVEIMRDQLEIERIVVVVGYLGDSLREFLGDGSQFGVEIDYVQNDELEKGLAWSISLAREKLTSDEFCVMLCDECYFSSNHRDILSHSFADNVVTCCGLSVDDNTLIQRNFAVYLDAQGGVSRLEEKPKIVNSKIMGTGTFLCQRAIFDHLDAAFAASEDGYVEFVSMLDDMHHAGTRLGYFQIQGTYVNVNDRDSLFLAKYHDRKRNFDKYSRSLLIYSEGEEENIDFTIQRYAELGVFSNITVVLPSINSIEEIVNNSGAQALICPAHITLYGEKLKYAMEMAEEDILVITEADYSFTSRDVEKLLTYLPEADMVIGTRTTRQLIEQGSSMRGLVRLANSILGRLVEFLWWNRQARFTDAGCTFRAIWKTSFNTIKDDINSPGPEFSVEMMIALLGRHQRVLEIPVNYFNRSQSIQKKYQSSTTFFRFVRLILRRRLLGK